MTQPPPPDPNSSSPSIKDLETNIDHWINTSYGLGPIPEKTSPKPAISLNNIQKMAFSTVGLALLIIGLVAGSYLHSLNTDNRQKAAPLPTPDPFLITPTATGSAQPLIPYTTRLATPSTTLTH